jgi:UDP-N-acetylmuramoyl-tripeptide--D-alanyl-D-alanine ligase
MLRNLSGTGRQVALLGAMGELGTWSERLHRKVGQTAVEKGVQLLFALGADSKFIIEAARQAGLSENQAQWFENHQTLLEAYEAISKSDDKILVKGSRSQKMEQVVRPLGESTCCITSIS